MRFLAAILLLTLTLRASLVPLEWDASPTPDVTYAIWEEIWPMPSLRIATSETTSFDLTGLSPGEHSLYVTAVKDGIQSDPSNTLVVEVPGGVGDTLRLPIVIEGSDDMLNWHVVAAYFSPGGKREFYRIGFKRTTP